MSGRTQGRHSQGGRTQGGFTLLELLVVIAVLGVLAGVAVLAVGRLRGTSQEVACDTDARVIQTAQSAYAVDSGSPGTEAELVDSGYLADKSQYHDVLVGADSYDLVAVGSCASGDQPNTLPSGRRILNAAEGRSVLRQASSWPPVLAPCSNMLTRDTGDRNQNPVPCNDGRLRRANPDDASCGPNRICDTDMAVESEPGS